MVVDWGSIRGRQACVLSSHHDIWNKLLVATFPIHFSRRMLAKGRYISTCDGCRYRSYHSAYKLSENYVGGPLTLLTIHVMLLGLLRTHIYVIPAHSNMTEVPSASRLFLVKWLGFLLRASSTFLITYIFVTFTYSCYEHLFQSRS